VHGDGSLSFIKGSKYSSGVYKIFKNCRVESLQYSVLRTRHYRNVLEFNFELFNVLTAANNHCS
jgi:hypothetical protein